MTPSGSIRLITLNVWAHSEPWAKRRALLRREFEVLRPDLVALVELVVTADEDDGPVLVGDGYQFVHATVRQPDGIGISIASRLPIVARYELDLRDEADRVFPACVLAVEVEAPAGIGRVLFANFNPSWGLHQAAQRERQSVRVARWIDGIVDGREMHVVVAGDMDSDPDATSTRFWTGRQSLDGTSVCFRDAWDSVHPGLSGDTFSAENDYRRDGAPDWPFSRIDYILVRAAEHAGSSLKITGCERAFDTQVDGVWPSDHFGVRADLAAR